MGGDVSVDEVSIPDSAWTAWKHSQNADTGGMCDCGHEGLGPGWHGRGCAGANFALVVKVQKLVHELYSEWSWNHAERCGVSNCKDSDSPDCNWPLPEGLKA